MPKLKKKTGKPKQKKILSLSKGRRKKHVETMFLTNKAKKYPYYFKDRNFGSSIATKASLLYPNRKMFAIRTLNSTHLELGPLKAVMRIFKWFTKTHKIDEVAKYRLTAFPDFVLTSKPKEIRMGKGKGAPDRKVALVRRGQILFQLRAGFEGRRYLALKLLKKIVHKLPLKNIVVINK
jgi:ribosomal protein L16/L10AE